MTHLTAVEIDESLADRLVARLAGANVHVVRGDAAALAFPDGRFTGVASFHMLHHIAPAEQQERVFAELARVLAPGGTLVAADGVHSDASAEFHEGDTYNPIDPDDLAVRLARVGSDDVDVRLHELGWVCVARTGAG